MKIKQALFLIATLALFTAPNSADAQGRPRPPRRNVETNNTNSLQDKNIPSIQWFATLERGLAEARRTGKPILFAAGAPHYAGVSGMW